MELLYMIIEGVTVCPCCGGELFYYGRVKRILRTKNRATKWIYIRRLRCCICGKFHREIPNYICPFKQYEYELICGVKEGFISSETLGYEDYPCEITMKRWKKG